MTLKNSLQISALFPIALAIIVSVVLVARARHMNSLRHQIDVSEHIGSAAARLNSVTTQLRITANRETLAAWRTAHSDLLNLVTNSPVDAIAAQIVLDSIRDAAVRMPDIADGCVSATEASQPDKAAGMARTLKDQSDVILERTAKLTRSILGQESSLQETLDLVFAMFMALAGLTMAGVTVLLSRDVINRVEQLSVFARSMASGDFNAPVDEKRHDELGTLAHAFSSMFRGLRSSQKTLESELKEHKRLVAASRESNIRLSDALMKLKRAQDQVVQQERLHALAQIVRGVSHDFNNALMPILGTTDFLLACPSERTDPARLLEHLKTMNEAAQLARDKIRNLSDFFQPTSDTTTAVSVNQSVHRVLDLTSPKWKSQASARGVTIDVKLELRQVPPVAAVQHDIDQALTGVILNAADAMPKGGTITISSRETDNMVAISVADTGTGMTPEVLQKCREPFFSTKGEEGTGMGLTVLTAIVKRHRGSMDIQSLPNKGTTVTIQFPVWMETRIEKEPAPGSAVGKLDILIVDDEQWARTIVERILTSDGHSVDVASNAEEGLLKLKARRFDLMITDQAMPDISGQDLAQLAKGINKDMRIVLLTGFGDLMMREGNKPGGVDLILAKPISTADLRNAIGQSLA